MKMTMQKLAGFGLVAVIAPLQSASCATDAPPASAVSGAQVPPTTVEAVGQVSEILPFPMGYLDPKALPDSLALLPPPPAEGTAAKAADEEAFRQAMSESAERQATATADAALDWQNIIRPFEEILGVSLSDGSKPHTEMLLQRSMVDGAVSTAPAKNHYQRVRPFVENNVDTCTPEFEEVLRADGSYPSGHAAMGWMLALVLTELVPDRQNELLQRGYEFGQSRVVCRAHWLSDTTMARVITSATFSRLQSDPTFQAQLELARAELD